MNSRRGFAMRPVVALAFMSTIAALGLGGCGPSPSSQARSAATDTAAAAGADTSHPPVPALAPGMLTPVDVAGLMRRVRAPGARATLVSCWATWCVPCREEMPELLKLARDYQSRGLRVMFVSTDFDSADAKKFLVRQGVEYETYFRVGPDMAFINGLDPHWTGSLPATFVYDSTGRLSRFWEGRSNYAKFESAVRIAMGDSLSAPPAGRTP